MFSAIDITRHACDLRPCRVFAGERECGQATVEAAFALPVLMLLILILLQPGILLYDRIVMTNAASEGCRVLMTVSDETDTSVENFVRRRLSAVPQTDIFHVHSSGAGCSWEIKATGNEKSSEVMVEISTKVKLLPLIGSAVGLFGGTDEAGNITLSVSSSMASQPNWVETQELGNYPDKWPGAWLK